MIFGGSVINIVRNGNNLFYKLELALKIMAEKKYSCCKIRILMFFMAVMIACAILAQFSCGYLPEYKLTTFFFFFFDQMPVVFSGQGGYGKRLSKLSEKPTNLLLPNF